MDARSLAGDVEDEALRGMLDACAENRSVASVILHGSRSVYGFARSDSDFDLLAVVDDPAEASWPWQAVPAWMPG